MSDHRVTLRPALENKPSIISPRINLQPLPEGHVIHILGKAGQADIAAFLVEITGGAKQAVRTAAPGQWFLVGNRPLPHHEITQLLEKLQPQAIGVDQSHGRVRMLAQGPMVERVLAKGTAVDLALTSFPVGQSATTLIGHVSAHITRVDEDGFEIMVLRGFAESLWDDLARMSAEFL